MEEVRRSRIREYYSSMMTSEKTKPDEASSNEAARGLRRENITTLDGSVAQFIVEESNRSGRQGMKERTWGKSS